MASKKDMRRADLSLCYPYHHAICPNQHLVIPYVEPVADKEETDMAGTDHRGGTFHLHFIKS